MEQGLMINLKTHAINSFYHKKKVRPISYKSRIVKKMESS